VTRDAGRRFRRAVETDDLDAIEALLADEVVLHSPVLNRPFHGKKLVFPLIKVIRRQFDTTEITDELDGAGALALIWRATLRDRNAEGTTILRFDGEGLIADVTTFLRPLSAALALAESPDPALAALVTARGGTP
jgi:hypothetical protein